jgi:effector-binding domain-containing protein
MGYEITTRALREQPSAVVRGTAQGDSLSAWLQDVYPEIVDAVRAAGEAPAGPAYGRFAFHGQEVHVEAGIPVTGPIQPLGRVEPGHLPGGVAAVAVHDGPYDGIVKAYDALQDWVLQHGYEKAEHHYESYVVSPADDPDPAHWRTEVIVPYRES